MGIIRKLAEEWVAPKVDKLIRRTIIPWAEKMEMVQELRKLGQPAVPALIRALKDDDWIVQFNAAFALGQLGVVHAIPALIEAMEDEKNDGIVRGEAAMALSKLGLPAVPALVAASEAGDALTQAHAVRTLGAIALDNPDYDWLPAVPAVLKALKSKHALVREEAAFTLGHIWSHAFQMSQESMRLYDASLDALILALEDDNGDVLKAAAEALGWINDIRGIPGLIKMMKDVDNDTRDVAVEALLDMGIPAFEHMTKAYQEGEIGYDIYEMFCRVLEKRLASDNFDKGTVAPMRKTSRGIDMERKAFKRRPEPGAIRKAMKRCFAGG